MKHRCKCGKFISDSDMGICNSCQIKLEKEETEKVNLRDEFPKITEWCNIRGMHTEWRCPNGCVNSEGEDDTEICDEGYVQCDSVIEFRCYHCKFSKKYKAVIQLVGGPEK